MSNPIFKFEDAQRQQCKASIMIEGLPGDAKSGTALMIAYFLSNKDWKKVYAIDTENKSLPLFVGLPSSWGGKEDPFGSFKVMQLTQEIGFKPTNYTACREVAVKSGAEVVIEDSISHAWQYKGGVLDIVNQAKERTKSKNDKYAAWGDPEVMQEKQELLALIRDSKVHVITTVRVKEKYDYEEVEGKKTLKSLGEQQIMQDDIKYEPDLVLRMVKAGSPKNHPQVSVQKSRYAIFEKGQVYEITPELCLQLKVYLEDGVDPQILLEQQKKDYVEAVTDHLNKNPGKKAIWQVMKQDAGLADTKLIEMELSDLKKLYLQLTV